MTDADAVSAASEGQRFPVIVSEAGNAVVAVVPPFPSDCKETVQRGLDALDPR